MNVFVGCVCVCREAGGGGGEERQCKEIIVENQVRIILPLTGQVYAFESLKWNRMYGKHAFLLLFIEQIAK